MSRPAAATTGAYVALGDVDSPEALADYQAAKRVHKKEWSRAQV
jgi:hypothetical protein